MSHISVPSRLVIVVGSMILSMGISCGRASKGTPLLAGLVSYMTPEEARSALGQSAAQWKVLQQHERNRHKYLVVQFDHFKDNEVEGTLVMDFYDEQLCQVSFYPSDVTRYRANFEKATGIRFSTDEAAELPKLRMKIPPRTEISIVRDLWGKNVVSAVDRDLFAQSSRARS